ncbi:hypothetical protein ACHAWO_007314 [Cyclotella atomus]|uniref:Uncharacterized protein n=1 Tax=Cyclotella atomus TaxID=382360 RepID=A0ABD3P4P8_9STRA
MTSTHKGIELACEFGDSFATILHQIWNLRITYPDPDSDIVCQANDVKSCSRQIKHHLDVAGAFSYYLQCGLAFGSDFSTQMWEVCRGETIHRRELAGDASPVSGPALLGEEIRQTGRFYPCAPMLQEHGSHGQAWPACTHTTQLLCG